MKNGLGNFTGSPVVKTLLSNAGGTGSIPGHKAKVPHASRAKSQNIKQERYCNRFNKDFKDGLHQKQSLKISGLKHCPERPGQQRRGGWGRLTWWRSRAMAVSVRAETCREQYCAKRLTWHMPFPNTHVLFTKRTCRRTRRRQEADGSGPTPSLCLPAANHGRPLSASLHSALLDCGSHVLFSSTTHSPSPNSADSDPATGAGPC